MSAPIDIRIVGDLAPTDWWENGITFAAAVVGALLGAGISYVIARQTARESRMTEELLRKDNEKLATHRVALRLMEIVNAAAGYHKETERCILELKNRINQEEYPNWLAMRQFAGRPIEITLEANDLVALYRAGEQTYISRIIFLFNSYNAMIYAVEGYSQRREALLRRISPESMNGLVVEFSLTPRTDPRLDADIVALEDLAKNVRAQMADVFNDAVKVIQDFKPIVRKYFRDPKFPVPEIVERP